MTLEGTSFLKIQSSINTMEITDTAFVIPVYPPHYHYIYNLIWRLEQAKIHIDIFVVFSNTSDFESFNFKTSIKPIIVSNMPEWTEKQSPIVIFKTYYALKQLMNSSYDYFIVCDSEIDIIPQNLTYENVTDKITSIFANKNVYSGDTSDNSHGSTLCQEVLRKSAEVFNASDREKLGLMTKNFTQYIWWSDIPVFRRADLDKFFARIDEQAVSWHAFNHIVYLYFLMLTDDFKLIDTTCVTNMRWSLEHPKIVYTETMIDKLSKLGVGFGWVVNKSFLTAKDYFINNKKTFIVYHLDR
jgi:hypothetical protein